VVSKTNVEPPEKAAATKVVQLKKTARTAAQQQAGPPFPLERDRIVRPKEACAMLGISKSTLYDAIRRGEFPAPKRIIGTGRAVGWPLSMVLKWVDVLK
jgi:prophage regulatory protein